MKPNSISCGEATATSKTLSTGPVDLIVTDPPHLCRYRDRTGRTLANNDNAAVVLPAFLELYRVFKPGGTCVLFSGRTVIAQFSAAWDRTGFRTVGHIVWFKGYTYSRRHLEHRHESAWVLTKCVICGHGFTLSGAVGSTSGRAAG